MHRKILYESRDSLKTLAHWYGERAVSAMLEITRIITPYMEMTYPRISFWYQSYFVTMTHDWGIENERILSNLIVDCPEFLPCSYENLPTLWEDGFLDLPTFPERQMHSITRRMDELTQQFTPPNCDEDTHVVKQDVISTRTLTTERLRRIFGEGVTKAIAILNNATENALYELGLEGEFPLRYRPYILRQWNEDRRLVYEGIALSSLIYGLPVIYPNRIKPHAANRTGGYRSISLPAELREQIASVDLRGCNIAS